MSLRRYCASVCARVIHAALVVRRSSIIALYRATIVVSSYMALQMRGYPLTPYPPLAPPTSATVASTPASASASAADMTTAPSAYATVSASGDYDAAAPGGVTFGGF